MRLALQGAGPLEWLALRLGLVPAPAAHAVGGMALSGIVVAAVRTGITARLAVGPATAGELADGLGLEPLPTGLLLDCLRSNGYVTERSGRYRLTRGARRWLDPASPLSVAGYVAGTADYWPWWSGLDDAVRTGKTSGSHEAPPGDPYWRRYIGGQSELARLSAAEVAKKIPLRAAGRDGARTVLDVGGGHGGYSAALCERHPDMRATVLDLPGSAAIGRELIAGSGLSERVTFRDGDATAADLAASSAADTDGGYDAVLCFNLVHHLTPGEAAALFARIGGVLRPGGTLAVLDVFAEPGRRASAHADLLALFTFLSSGARGHTPADLAAWLEAAGLTPPRKVPLLRIPGLALQVATKPTT